ncbi:MAG: GAF domain-containing protein [Cyanobacteria bacterium]|nr:GAF domain-containing protein [Cyanobacteriota bacterium]
MTSREPLLSLDQLPVTAQSSQGDLGLERITQRLVQVLERDTQVQTTLHHLRDTFQVDRVVLYYFYRRWKGQVTAEALRAPSFAILGSTGADDCFTDEYAQQYLEGRIRAIADVTQADIHPCHLEFLRSIQVQANLVAPVLVKQQLWGLLAIHDCQGPRPWSEADIAQLTAASEALSASPALT